MGFAIEDTRLIIGEGTWWYRHAHYVHHESLSPSPWASFSFHPLESVIEALFIPALVFVVPIHVAGLLFVLTSMTIFGVRGDQPARRCLDPAR